jgi:predicted dehydrogenase
MGTCTFIPRHLVGAPGKGAGPQRGSAICGLGRGGGFDRSALAVCDPDQNRVKASLAGRPGACKGYTDFREIIDRKDIGKVWVVTPPHWHAIISIMAMKAGKDVFCEKPLTRTIGEGKAFVEAVRRYGCDFGYGASHETPHPRMLRKVAVSGILGTPLTIYIRGSRRANFKVGGWRGMVNQVPQPVPPTLDWNLYCGPSPLKPYHQHRTHGSFRGYWDYDGGGLTDMAGHVLNDLLDNIGKDDTSPSEIETIGPPAHDDAVGIFDYSRLRWADGTVLVIDSGVVPPSDGADPDIFVEGPKGRLRFMSDLPGFNTRDAHGRGDEVLTSDPPRIIDELRRMPDPPNPSPLVGLPGPLAGVIHAHRTISLANLLNTSLRVGRKIRFDPVAEEVIGDEEANRLANPTFREPWHV